jgi:hypothetical protein
MAKESHELWSWTRLGKVSDPLPKLENQADFFQLPWVGKEMGLVSLLLLPAKHQ